MGSRCMVWRAEWYHRSLCFSWCVCVSVGLVHVNDDHCLRTTTALIPRFVHNDNNDKRGVRLIQRDHDTPTSGNCTDKEQVTIFNTDDGNSSLSYKLFTASHYNPVWDVTKFSSTSNQHSHWTCSKPVHTYPQQTKGHDSMNSHYPMC